MMQTTLPVEIQNALTSQDINSADVNLILPTQTFGDLIGKYDKLFLEIVRINPGKDDGEVFEITKGKKSFTKIALLKIGNALGVIWDPDRTGVIESTSTKSRAKAVGALRKPNGEWISLADEKTVDLEVIKEEQQIKFEEQAEKGNPDKVTKWGRTKTTNKPFPKAWAPWQNETEKNNWIDRQVRKAVLQYKKFKDERAMTGAKERVIKALVAIKSTYTNAELSRPFVFPRIILDTSKMMQDESTRDAAIEKMTGAASAIFGKAGGSLKPHDNTLDEILDAEVIPVEDEIPLQDDKSSNPPPNSEIDYQAEMPDQRDGALDEAPLENEDLYPVDEFEDFSEDSEDPWDDDEDDFEAVQALRTELTGYVTDKRLPPEAKRLITNLLKDDDASLEELEEMKGRVNTYLSRKARKADKMRAAV